MLYTLGNYHLISFTLLLQRAHCINDEGDDAARNFKQRRQIVLQPHGRLVYVGTHTLQYVQASSFFTAM